MLFRICSLLILALLTVSLPAQASRWYPIETGLCWFYSSPLWGSQSVVIKAPVSFAGSLVQPRHWDSGVREYLSLDGSSRVLSHGVTYSDGSYVVFDPPILRMDSELLLGHEWETMYHSTYYTVDGVETRREQARSAYRVIALGPVTVAAGTFPSAEVLRTEETASLPDFLFRETYAENVGWILRTDESGSSVHIELEAYGEGGVSTEVMTWGGVKALFR